MARPKAERINTLSDYQIRSKYDLHKENGWNLYDERELLENVIAQRVNFLVASYALFLTAAASLIKDGKNQLWMVFFLGFFLLGMLSLTVYRVYKRLDVVSKMLYKLDDFHVFPIIQKEMKSLGWKAFRNANPIIGIWIPLFCILTMFIGLIGAISLLYHQEPPSLPPSPNVN